MSTRIGVYCDLGPTLGAGHLVRCSALGAALAARGAEVSMIADFASVPWARRQVEGLGLRAHQADGVHAFVEESPGWDAAVLDSYLVTGGDLAGLAAPLVVIDDEAPRVLPAALVINQNLSAHTIDYADWPGAQVLRGPRFALLRPEFAAARPATYRRRDWTDRPQRVLVLLGGTDALGGAARVTARLLGALGPVHLRVLCATDALRDAVAALHPPDGSTVEALRTVDDVTPLMNWADLVVCGGGTTVWELCCLGAPMAVLTIAENQRASYELLIKNDLALGLGWLSDALDAPDELWRRLGQTDVNDYGERAFALVDGRGAERVAESIVELAR